METLLNWTWNKYRQNSFLSEVSKPNTTQLFEIGLGDSRTFQKHLSSKDSIIITKYELNLTFYTLAIEPQMERNKGIKNFHEVNFRELLTLQETSDNKSLGLPSTLRKYNFLLQWSEFCDYYLLKYFCIASSTFINMFYS